MHLVFQVVDDEEQTACFRGGGGMILTRACGGIVAGGQGVVFKNQITLQHIAVLEAGVMMRGIMRAGNHPDQGSKFSAKRIFVQPRDGNAGEGRGLLFHLLASN